MPAAERAARLRNPGGPIAGPEFGSALTAVGLWQAVFFIARAAGPSTRSPAAQPACSRATPSSSAWAH